MRAPSKYKFVSLQSVALSAFIFTLLCAVFTLLCAITYVHKLVESQTMFCRLDNVVHGNLSNGTQDNI